MVSRTLWCTLLVLSSLAWKPGPAAASEDAYEHSLDSLLAVHAPGAVEAWRAANRASESGSFDSAKAAYREVIRRAPEFWPAYRRAATLESHHGDRQDAYRQFERLLLNDSSAVTLGAAASAIARVIKQDQGWSLRTRGEELADRAIQGAPDDAGIWLNSFEVGYATEDTARMGRAVVAMQRLTPQWPVTWATTTLDALLREDARSAKAALEQLRATGGDPRSIEALREQVRELERRQWPGRLFRWTLTAIGVWFGVFLLLLLISAVLSRAALAAAERQLAGAQGDAVGMERWLRAAYAGTLLASCFFFYVSLPLLLVVVVGGGLGIVVGMIMLKQVQIQLLVVTLMGTFMTAWAILRAVAQRPDHEDPGVELAMEHQPRFRACLEEVAARIGTRPVDRVFLTQGTEVAVYERGGRGWPLVGDGERCLILGVGVIQGFSLSGWKAVLAHEYGHFVNRDTAGGGLSLAVRRTIGELARGLVETGAATRLNPAWWFVRGFHAAFMRVSQGASRLQEVLADRWAVSAYGSASFTEGLRHVIERSVRFSVSVDLTLGQALKLQRPVVNLYSDGEPLTVAHELQVTQVTEAAITRKPGPFDSHPAPQQRFEWAKRIATHGSAASDTGALWDLLDEREVLERYMTALICANVEAHHGVAFAK